MCILCIKSDVCHAVVLGIKKRKKKKEKKKEVSKKNYAKSYGGEKKATKNR